MKAYTAKEIMEILEKAKELGVVSLNIEGIQVSWNVSESKTIQVSRAPSKEITQTDSKKCPKCRSEMEEGQYGVYCRECYLKRKDANFSKSKNW